MDKFDLVRLKNAAPYAEYGLQGEIHGIVLSVLEEKADVLFYNAKNIGNYAIVNVNTWDIAAESEMLPKKIQSEIESKLDWLKANASSSLTPAVFKEYDYVELINDEKYKQFGIHNGDVGCIMHDTTIK
ncbi:MAG: hypothetical protein K2J20_00210, partial [Bacilli bacterium]|nr:hypothetical protein [Bacilli bacterium]